MMMIWIDTFLSIQKLSCFLRKDSTLKILQMHPNTNMSKKGANRSSRILEIIHTDICCPDMDAHGQKYFITFIVP